MRARYYDPVTGRFISEDPSQNGANWFAYAGGNPVSYTDSTGKSINQALLTAGEWLGGFMVGDIACGLLAAYGDFLNERVPGSGDKFLYAGLAGVGYFTALVGLQAATFAYEIECQINKRPQWAMDQDIFDTSTALKQGAGTGGILNGIGGALAGSFLELEYCSDVASGE